MKRTILWKAAVISALGLVSCAEVVPSGDLEGRTISRVVIRQERPKNVEDEMLRKFISTAPGLAYDPARADQDIKSLYESGLVSDVRFLATPDGEKVRVTVEVEARPRIGPGPGFVGNTVFSDQKLAKVTGLRSGDLASRDSFAKACRRVEDFYRRHGYREVRVTTRSSQDVAQPETVLFVFIVEEGSKGAE